MTLHIETPLLESHQLSLICDRKVWLKMEALQPPGSFKIRGIGLACETYAKQGAQRFISSSGGNAGIAVAYAGRMMSIPVTVVVPESTSEKAKELLLLENATIVVKGVSWQEANEFAMSLIEEKDAFIHPFDNPLLWQGHATIVDEIIHAGVKPDAIVLSVGGGGLLCGVAEGLCRNNWGDIPILAVETEGAASYRKATLVGHPIQLSEITSVATSLGAKCVCEKSVQWSKVQPISSVLVSDRAALFACERFYDDYRVIVEPACGASLALAYEKSVELQSFETILIVVCGGVTATRNQIREWSKIYE